MTAFLLIVRLVVVVIFFLMFLRRPNLVWGVGLLTVTTAVLLDAYVTIMGGAEALEALGFFLPVLEGGLLGGAAVWVLGIARPLLGRQPSPAEPLTSNPTPPPPPQAVAARPRTQPDVATDRQQLYELIRHRLGREDVLDLIYDLGFSENDVLGLDGGMNPVIVRVMDLAAERGQTGELAVAVERILTPLPAESLPRREKLSSETPPTLLRQFMMAHCDLAGLQALAAQLEVDWEQLGSGGKQARVRGLLLHLSRRNRLQALIDLLQTVPDAAAS